MSDIKDKPPLSITLLNGLPEHRSRLYPYVLSYRKVGADLGISFQAIYAWTKKDRLPANRIEALVNLNGSTLKKEVLVEYVY